MALCLRLDSLDATDALGARIARALRQGDAVLLSGAYGTGKTTLVRALLRTLNANPELDVPSPSYTLLQTYETPIGRVHHFDLWRLGGADTILELGWDEARTDIVLVEWPERLGSLRPVDALAVDLAYEGDNQRHATLSGWRNERL